MRLDAVLADVQAFQARHGEGPLRGFVCRETARQFASTFEPPADGECFGRETLGVTDWRIDERLKPDCLRLELIEVVT